MDIKSFSLADIYSAHIICLPAPRCLSACHASLVSRGRHRTASACSAGRLLCQMFPRSEVSGHKFEFKNYIVVVSNCVKLLLSAMRDAPVHVAQASFFSERVPGLAVLVKRQVTAHSRVCACMFSTLLLNLLQE